MPITDQRTKSTLRDAQHQTAGRLNVIYIDSKRRSRQALVRGPGTTSGLKLWVPSLHTQYDNVPLAASRTSVNCYVAR